MTAISVTAFTDTGLTRSRNEDAVLVGGWLCQTTVGSVVTITFADNAPFVTAVADGMGGHAGGELASRVALGVIADAAPTWNTADDVTASLRSANERVFQAGMSNPDLHGLGTTVAGICVLPTTVVVFNVGDSRVYGITNGFLQQISADDAVTDENGRPTNLITQSLGQREPVEPHIITVPRDGTSYLLCSDGVSGIMSAAELRAAALKTDPSDFASEIVRATRDGGAADNFSLVIVTVPAAATEGKPHPANENDGAPPAITGPVAPLNATNPNPAAEPAVEQS